MPWTLPATWVDGVIVTASALNLHVRDNLRYLKGLDGAPYIENAIDLPENVGLATPASGRVRIYAKSDGWLYSRDDAGVEQLLSAFGYGTSFPASPQTGQRYFRTDLGWLCFFDGTRWLTVHEYETVLSWFQLVGLPYGGAAPQTLLLQPIRSDYGYYLTRAQAYIRVATTNNGSNFWGMRLLHSSSNLWDFNTSASAPDTNLFFSTSLASAQSAATTFLTVNAQSKTGAPGAVTSACTVWYRLIVT